MKRKRRRTKKEVEHILNTAMKHIESVPYRVSLRWLFYRLYQDGIYKTKDDYKAFTDLQAGARKSGRLGWKPDTLKDDTRGVIWRGVGSFNKREWLEKLECKLDKFQNQDYFVVIMFEALAMQDQFAWYTKNIPLLPFQGDFTIEPKYRVANNLKQIKEKYNKPIVLLYFGDCDDKGKQIPESAIKDIRLWSGIDFKFVFCGLTKQQAMDFNLPLDIKGKGNYQWEALTDEQAREIISINVEKYQDKERFKEIEKKEERINRAIKKLLK